MRSLVRSIVIVTISVQAAARGSDGWRGDGSGIYPEATPPTEWSESETVIWKTKLPNWSNGSPLLVGKRLFVTAEPAELICMDAGSGEILWSANNHCKQQLSPEEQADRDTTQATITSLRERRDLADKELKELEQKRKDAPEDAQLETREKELRDQLGAIKGELEPLEKSLDLPGCHGENGYTSPTPTTDGKHIFTVNGMGVVTAHDLKGNRKWRRRLAMGKCQWGHSGSPMLVQKKLIVPASEIIALNPSTGATLWTTKTGANNGSPAVMEFKGEAMLVTTAGQIIRVSDGEEIAKDLGSLPYDAPVTEDDRIYFFGVDNQRCRAYRLEKSPAGGYATERIWETEVKKGRYYGSPVIYKGVIYGIHQSGDLTALDAMTGEKLFEQKIDFGKCTFYPSLAVANGELYVMADNGMGQILKPGRTFEPARQTKVERFRSSLLFAGDRVYLRGMENAYCIGEKAP